MSDTINPIPSTEAFNTNFNYLDGNNTNTYDDSSLNNSITSGEEILYDLLFNDEKRKPAKHTDNSTLLRTKKSFYDSNAQASSANIISEFNNDPNSDYGKSSTLDKEFAYLQEINSYHIDRLQAEPSILLESQQHIQEEIKNLAFTNYKTFIRTAQCSREIYSDFSIIESKLDQLITKLPEFGNLCENFTKNIQLINASRKTNNLTLQKHNQLLEILEISQLMDTCVRNEYYEEALDLAAYVKRLEKKFASNIPLIQKIVDDVNRSLNLMLKQLLQQLKTNLQFNQCLKIISIIRRLDLFTESELRIKFLQLRDCWLQSLLQSIPQTDPYHHISKTIEENRIHLFDIITQYRALFSDDDLITTSNSSSASGTGSKSTQLNNIFLSSNKDLNESKLFYCWLQQKIKNFLNVLRKDLKLGVGNRLDSVMSQAMYFGLAFSRVGLDFRVLMVPIFEDAILQQLSKSLGNANVKFEESLSKMNWSDLNLDHYKSIEKLQPSLAQENLSNNSLINPPIQLLEFQPLAIYLNILLQSFNELRLCAPINLFTKVINQLRVSLKRICDIVSVYYKKEKVNFDKNENELFTSFLYELAYTLIPFLERCLLVLFPIEQIQKVYGIAQNDIIKLKKSFKFNNDLFESIKEYVPPKKETASEVANNEKKTEESPINGLAKKDELSIEQKNEETNLTPVLIESNTDEILNDTKHDEMTEKQGQVTNSSDLNENPVKSELENETSKDIQIE